MTKRAEALAERFFPGDHPYRTYELEVGRVLRPEHTLLDAGCGRGPDPV